MNAEQLYAGLALTGYPVAYHKFKSAQSLPFIVYRFGASADLMADNGNYHSISDFEVELYTANKDPTAEAAVEAQLAALGLAYGKVESYVADEEMYQLFYTVRSLTAGGN